jgi:hypothetical protein
MEKLLDRARRVVTTLLALLLWSHALFLLSMHSALAVRYARFLDLTYSEFLLLSLIVVFSVLAASGFWRMVLSLAYIYFFPFVVLGGLLYWCFLAFRALHRWFQSKSEQFQRSSDLASKQIEAITASESPPQEQAPRPKKTRRWVREFVLRPFKRFMVLWCLLLLFTTHQSILWLALFVVSIHLARRVFAVLRGLLLCDMLLNAAAKRMVSDLEPILVALAAISHDTSATSEVQTLWNKVKGLRKILQFLRDPYLVSRWAYVAGAALVGSIYCYFAFLFSFVYYGIAKVNGIPYAWPDAFVTSAFIPFLITDFPKSFVLRLVGGLHCTLLLAVGIGTLMKFIQKRLDAISKAASVMSKRFSESSVHEKYLILEEKFTASRASTAPSITSNSFRQEKLPE